MTNSNGNQKKNDETDLQWILRYMFIPLAVATVAGLFALAAVSSNRRSDEEGNQATQVYNVIETLAAMTPKTVTIIETVLVTTIATVEITSPPPATATATPENLTQNVCGQAPLGWQLYFVRWGDTLFSLSRRSGASITQIQQVNCLNDNGLKANTNIWLPNGIQTVLVPIEIPDIPSLLPVDSEPPVVTILTPVNGLSVVAEGYDDVFWFTEQLLSGTGIDAQEGVLSEKNFVWTTNQSSIQEGALGIGTQIVGKLLLDGCNTVDHTVRLTVTDSAGNVGQDEVMVRVTFVDSCFNQ